MRKSEILEIAQISAILSENYTTLLYNKLGNGYIDTTSRIAEWAYEFYLKHKKTNWEEVLEHPESFGFTKDCYCWDDAIIFFGKEKLNSYDK